MPNILAFKTSNESGFLVFGMSNAKYLAFDIPNTKKPLSLDVLNAKIFGIDE